MKYGETGKKLAVLSRKVASWAISPSERELAFAAENAAHLANLLAPARRHSKLGARLAHLSNAVARGLIAGSEVEEGGLSPDTGELDQSNEENPSYQKGFEAPASEPQRAMAPDKAKAGSKRAADADPARDVEPPDSPAMRDIPSSDESTSDELDGHDPEKTGSRRKSDDGAMAGQPPSENVPADDAAMSGEDNADDIEFTSEGESSMDMALASDDEEGGKIAGDDDAVLDILFEGDSAKAAQKMAALQQKQAATQKPKVGAKKVGMGSKVAAGKPQNEIQMLEKTVWSSKPNVSKFFGQEQ